MLDILSGVLMFTLYTSINRLIFCASLCYCYCIYEGLLYVVVSDYCTEQR
jgi:hypothetical protein